MQTTLKSQTTTNPCDWRGQHVLHSLEMTEECLGTCTVSLGQMSLKQPEPRVLQSSLTMFNWLNERLVWLYADLVYEYFWSMRPVHLQNERGLTWASCSESRHSSLPHPYPYSMKGVYWHWSEDYRMILFQRSKPRWKVIDSSLNNTGLEYGCSTSLQKLQNMFTVYTQHIVPLDQRCSECRQQQ